MDSEECPAHEADTIISGRDIARKPFQPLLFPLSSVS